MELVEPIGERRADYRAALIARTMAATYGAKCSINDFLLEFGKQKQEPRQTEAEMISELESFLKAENGN